MTREKAEQELVEVRGDAGHGESVTAQLERVLTSGAFAQADQLKRFLAFIVGEGLAGRGPALKEYVVAVRVFRKDASFDPRTDPIVRVQARRLRTKLERYYQEEGARDAILIELPRGGYAPVFRHRVAPPVVHRPARSALLARNTVVIQPLADLSARGELAPIGEGVRAEIVRRLTRLAGLQIVDGTPVGTSPALIVGGSLRRSAGDVRVSLHLVDGATNAFRWADAFDGAIADPLPVQERAAEALLDVLSGELRASTGGHSRRGAAENLAAQSFCLQGRYHLSQRTEEGLRRAVDFFERAIAEDERHALAHSGLADAYGLLGHYAVLGPAEVWTKAASLAASAVLLDDQSAEAHTSLAHVRSTQDWDWAGAEREFRRALQLDPQYATAHHWFAASCLAPLGRLDEALDEMLPAQALDPVSAIGARDVAVLHFYRRAFDAALERCDHTIELNPYFAPAYVTLGLIQEQRGELDESAAAFQRALQLAPNTPRVVGALARTFALSGHATRAIEALETLKQLATNRYVSPLDFAWVSLALGHRDEGFYWLTKAFDDRTFDLICIRVDPRFDSLRVEEQFVRLERRLALTPPSGREPPGAPCVSERRDALRTRGSS